jgi:NAD(P)-dependent dehydrogenase (short-subunit alcohol dehydrogenase family)
MSFLSSGVAVVTGAGSGIGRALARELAAAGSALALADIDEAGLEETAESIETNGAARAKAGRALDAAAKNEPLITTHVVDVAQEESVKSLAADVRARHGRVTLLVNNAGVALHGSFEEISLDDFRWLVEINFWGAVYGVKYFLPLLKREPRAHIVNLSSAFGIIAPPGQTAYSASKFAVRGFSEALRHELEGSKIGVSCVHPGGIRTSIARRARLGAGASPATREESLARFERLARTSPETAAGRILRGVERREPRILVGLDAHEIDFLQRLRPATYWKWLARRLKDASAASKPSTLKQPSS